MKTGYKNKKFCRLRVPASLLGVILVLILAQPTSLSIIIGATISLFGFLLRYIFSEHVFPVVAGFSLRKLKLAATFKTLIYYVFTEHLPLKGLGWGSY